MRVVSHSMIHSCWFSRCAFCSVVSVGRRLSSIRHCCNTEKRRCQLRADHQHPTWHWAGDVHSKCRTTVLRVYSFHALPCLTFSCPWWWTIFSTVSSTIPQKVTSSDVHFMALSSHLTLGLPRLCWKECLVTQNLREGWLRSAGDGSSAAEGIVWCCVPRDGKWYGVYCAFLGGLY